MFSFDKKGAIKPIAQIISNDELDGKLLYLHRKKDGMIPKGYFDEITLENGKFEYFPEIREQYTDVILCAGVKGSGKSTLVGKMAEKIKDVYGLDDSDCVVLKKSHIKDPAFSDLNPDYIYVDQDFLDNEYTIDDFTNENGKPKVVIIDDNDVIPSAKLKKELYCLQDTIAVEGRKHKIFEFVVRHSLCQNKDTKLIISECDYVLLFPEGFTSDINYFLQTYCDFSNDLIRDIKKTRSKWMLLSRIAPTFILLENRCFIFDMDREEDRIKNIKEMEKIEKKRKEKERNDNYDEEDDEKPKRLLKKYIRQ